MRVVSNSRANNVQLMDAAEVPGGPYTPNHGRDWLMALVLGLALGVAFAYTVEYLDDTVKIPDDLTRRLRLPLLGLVPAVAGGKMPVLLNPVPHDFGEAFRSLRTSLVFTNGTDGKRMIAVTSSQPLEGKTTTACNLAVALALGGSRVMLIDADMRRPGLHRTLGLQNEVGLSHVLTGQARVREAVQRTSEPNLYVMTAGRTPPNPSELLSSARMQNLIANLKAGPFDWVIIDTPPVLAVTDAVIIAPYVSGLVFVVGAEMTRRAHAERAIQTIQSGRPNIIGAVLNRVDREPEQVLLLALLRLPLQELLRQRALADERRRVIAGRSSRSSCCWSRQPASSAASISGAPSASPSARRCSHGGSVRRSPAMVPCAQWISR